MTSHLTEVIENMEKEFEALEGIPFKSSVAKDPEGNPVCSVDLTDTVAFFKDFLRSYTSKLLSGVVAEVDGMKKEQTGSMSLPIRNWLSPQVTEIKAMGWNFALDALKSRLTPLKK